MKREPIVNTLRLHTINSRMHNYTDNELADFFRKEFKLILDELRRLEEINDKCLDIIDALPYDYSDEFEWNDE